MPSTYSSLKIQLMATGENNTTWGAITNINLGTALEEAIVGSATVTFAGVSRTLDLVDSNASQPARNVRLDLAGTLSGPSRNLTVPAIEKPYIINNGTDGTVTVKNATGTGIAVPTGKTTWVYNDGTNVVDAVNYLTSLTLGAALPVASGGTGAATFTANYLLKGNGTGALALSSVQDNGTKVSIGGDIGTTASVLFRLPVTGVGGNAQALSLISIIQPDVVTVARGYYSALNTAGNGGTGYTIAELYHNGIGEGTYNVDSTITEQTGYAVSNGFKSAATNYGFRMGNPGAAAITAGKTVYGFRSEVPIATGGGSAWNFYASSTAANYLNGSLYLGGVPGDTTTAKIALTAFQNGTDVTGYISGITLTVTAGATGTLAVGQPIWGPGIAVGTYITEVTPPSIGGVGPYKVSISQTVGSSGSPITIATVPQAANRIRFHDTGTFVGANQQLGTIDWYSADSSSPGAGPKAFITVVTETPTPDAAIVFGTADNTSASVGPVERLRITSDGYVGVGNSAPTQALAVSGAVGYNAPVTVTDATYTVGIADNWIIANRNGTVTLTLPAAASFTGRILTVKNVQPHTVISASSNVVPMNSTAAGTAILAATDGKFATLVSDGTNWVIMQAN